MIQQIITFLDLYLILNILTKSSFLCIYYFFQIIFKNLRDRFELREDIKLKT